MLNPRIFAKIVPHDSFFGFTLVRKSVTYTRFFKCWWTPVRSAGGISPTRRFLAVILSIDGEVVTDDHASVGNLHLHHAYFT